jgi:hypothetical protein
MALVVFVIFAPVRHVIKPYWPYSTEISCNRSEPTHAHVSYQTRQHHNSSNHQLERRFALDQQSIRRRIVANDPGGLVTLANRTHHNEHTTTNTPQRTHVSDIEKRNPHDQHTGSANSLQIRSESGECTWQIHTTLTIHNSQVRWITSPQHTWHPSSGTCECNGSVCDTISCVTAQSSIQYNHNHQ